MCVMVIKLASVTDLNDYDVDIENLQNDDDVGIDKFFATLRGSNYRGLVGNLVGSTTDSICPKTELSVLLF